MNTTHRNPILLLFLGLGTALLVTGLASPHAYAHCQVPCGIFDDAGRVKGLREDLTTIEKAITTIGELAPKRDPQSQNQLVRWVNTKEQHADKIIHLIADYFLAQKIKPAAADKGKDYTGYIERLTRHHAVMVAAVKCKQTVDMGAVHELKRAIDGIAGYWK